MCHDAVLAEHDGDIANVHNDDMCNNVQCNHGKRVIGVEGLYSVRLKGGRGPPGNLLQDQTPPLGATAR
jgi:hypothetical protein